MKRQNYLAHDGKNISLVIWDEVKNPKAVIQISHGMVEHALRYEKFAAEMNSRGYIVAADDHRAHGETDRETLGYSAGDIWENTLKDLDGISKKLKKEYGLPLFLLGHSYGSFLTQAYLERYGDNLCGAIVGGSNKLKRSAVVFGKLFADLGCAFGAENKPANFIKKNTFDVYNKKYKDGTTFISSIESECRRYEKDELCSFVCSNNFYKRFFGGAKKLYTKKSAAGLRSDLPLLLISGDADPVGEYGKGVKRLYEFYKKSGVKNVNLKLYKGVRHEYFNDVCSAEVMRDVAEFVEKTLSAAENNQVKNAGKNIQ